MDAPVLSDTAAALVDGARQAAPGHDKAMAARFLACLDPSAQRFTFQFFGDGPDRYAKIVHGTLDQVWPEILALNTPERRVGAFVTVAETDFKGRREENIVRSRALYVDADSPEQIATSTQRIEAAGATPSAIVDSGRGVHSYWFTADVQRAQFSALQKGLIEKLGTDKSIHDLSRVMRLPGTLHLKDVSRPRLVTLRPTGTSVRRWQLSDLIAKFGGLPTQQATVAAANNVLPFRIPAWAYEQPDEAFQHLSPSSRLSDGLEANINEIIAATNSIPASAIAAEDDWHKLTRAFAHEAALFPKHKEQLWEILDTVSQRAPNYNHDGNRQRFERYIGEALRRSHPITISTLFNMALDHGWDGRPVPSGHPTPPTKNPDTPNPSSGPTNLMGLTTVPPTFRAVHVGALPPVPPKREWLHGTDLIRGAVTVLAAPGGRAKSTWWLACALACASGRGLLGSHVFGGPLRVLLVSTEDGLPELTLRLRAAMAHHKLSDADLPGLHLIGADRWGLPLLRMEGNRAVLDTAGMNALLLELEHLKPDVLIIDPLINLLGGVSANDNAGAALLMRQLVSLATTRRMAVALAHHTSKGRDLTSAESAMGAASFINLARVALSIETLEEKNAATVGLPPWEAKSVFRLVGTKHNLSPPRTEDRWFRLVSVKMNNAAPPIYLAGDSVAVVEPFQPGVSGPAFPDALVRDALIVIDAATPSLTPSKRSSERYAAPVIADAIKSHRSGQASEADGKAVLDHLINAGLVAVADVKVARAGKRSDILKGLVLTPLGKLVRQQTTQTLSTNPNPQPPQCPATTLQDDAGGDAPASPATQGGCGGNAGENNRGQAALRRSDT